MSLNPISPLSLIMTEYTPEDEINENNVKRYLTSTVRVAKKEYQGFCCDMWATACCVSTFCFGVIFCAFIANGLGLTAALTTSGICSLGCTCCICMCSSDQNENSSYGDYFKYRYFKPQTSSFSKFSYTSRIVHKIMNFEISHDEIMICLKYGILTENTARCYQQLILNKNKLDEDKSQILKEKSEIGPKVTLNPSFTNIEVIINDISLENSKDKLLTNPDYQSYVEKIAMLDDRMKILEVTLEEWHENKNNLIEQLKNELPILGQNDEEINLGCYSLFCKDKF